MKKVLILTGCAGFIGINALEKLHGNHSFDYIISIDKMGYATKYNSKRYYDLCDEIRSLYNIDCDINDIQSMKNLCDLEKWTFIDDWKETDVYILDFASESHVDNSIADPFSIFTQNASIPANLLAWIGKENWNRIKAYYHISTDEVYGEIPLNEIHDEKKWFDIKNNFNPNNPYSASKASQDCLLMSLRHTFKLPVKFIRMANQMPGKFQHPEKFLMGSILHILDNKPVTIYGNGENVRQWTPIDITSIIILDILNEKIKFDDVIHIGNRFGIYNNNEIVNILEEVIICYGYKTKRCYIKDRLGHDAAYILKTNHEIDSYFTNNDLKKSIKTCIEYCIKNKELFS